MVISASCACRTIICSCRSCWTYSAGSIDSSKSWQTTTWLCVWIINLICSTFFRTNTKLIGKKARQTIAAISFCVNLWIDRACYTEAVTDEIIRRTDLTLSILKTIARITNTRTYSTVIDWVLTTNINASIRLRTKKGSRRTSWTKTVVVCQTHITLAWSISLTGTVGRTGCTLNTTLTWEIVSWVTNTSAESIVVRV